MGWRLIHTLGFQNQWDMFPKCSNLRIEIELNIVSLERHAMSRSKNRNEVPVQRGCLYFCTNIHNIFLIPLQRLEPDHRPY